jgi:tRNA 2-thiocytidine biosynthesis protein TtcA
VVTTHLLDRRLQDFAAIRASGVSMPGGDIAFDDDPCVASSSGTVSIAPVD